MALHRALCPRFHKAVELVGARWTGAIIHLLLPGRARFSELRLAIPDLSDRMLSERLRELEGEGIVERMVIPEIPVRVEYALTDKGRALRAALDALGKWAERWVSPEDVAGPSAPQPRRVGRAAPRSAHRPATRKPSRSEHLRVKPGPA
jgi:DNA-binding HxlR family transcriptional regulator